MPIQITTVVMSLLGVTFIFAGYFVQLFFFLWVMYALLIPIDIYTRTRIEKLKRDECFKTIQRTTVRSYRMRDGLIDKVILMIIMLALSVVVYFSAGAFGVDWITLAMSVVLTAFMALFLTNEFKSVVENMLEYNEYVGIKPSSALLLLGKVLGLVGGTISKRIKSEVNQLTNDDDRIK